MSARTGASPMNHQPSSSHPSRARRPATLLAGIALLAVVAVLVGACGASGVGDGGPLVTRPPESGAPTPSPEPTATPGPTDTPEPSGTPEPSSSPGSTPGQPTPTPKPTASPAGTTALKVYFFANGRLVAVQRTVPFTVATSRAAITQLIAGPSASERSASPALTSAVPSGSLLLGINIANGLATVDLSREFESGGGSSSMYGRLAQVVFTLTQFPTVDRVAFRLDGQPVTVFSGEGIVLSGPSVRDDYTAFLPPIFIDRPAYGGTLGNPARITGLSNVFEATFLIEIRDPSGGLLVRRQAMATCGTGCWGTFDVTIPYQVGARLAGTVGTVRVYDLSAKDGSVQDLVIYPVTLTAG